MHFAVSPRPTRNRTGSKAAAGRILLLLSIWCALLPVASAAGAPPAAENLERYISNGGYGVEMNGKVIFADNLHTPFIPASTLKVLTSLMALEILGPEYRFATTVYVDNTNVLYLRGEGDPLFTSETITTIARELKKRGIAKIDGIVLDDSAFALETPPPGSDNSHNPYDAHSSALAVNFNSLPFMVTALGTVRPGEKQTPLLPIMKTMARGLYSGTYRLNVEAFAAHGDISNTLRYTGELLTALLQENHLIVTGGFSRGRPPSGLKPLFVYESEKTVTELVRLCLHYSSNFIANQLYLSSGRRLYGSPATWEKARRMTHEFLKRRLPTAMAGIRMVDGSGLSADNSMTASAMLEVLQRFAPYAHLLKKQQQIYVKSGTLTGVYCYAGYFETAHRLDAFALFLNQPGNTRKKTLVLLEKQYRQRVQER